MEPIQFAFATAADEVNIRSSLSAAGLPAEDLSLEHFIVAKHNGDFGGCIGLESYGSTGLLRSLVVKPDFRNLGIARQLCNHLVAYAKEQRVQDLYLLTTTAADYFEKLGFTRISRDQAPAVIQGHSQFTALCPSSAVLMRKKI